MLVCIYKDNGLVFLETFQAQKLKEREKELCKYLKNVVYQSLQKPATKL